MRWSLKIGRFAGIDVYVHATFFLLILWVIALHSLQGRNPQAVISGVAFILALFACVVAHEFGHALTARHYGMSTKDITCCRSVAYRVSSACRTSHGRSSGWHLLARS